MSDIETRQPVNLTDVDTSISVLGDGTDERNIGSRSDPLKERSQLDEEHVTDERRGDRGSAGVETVDDGAGNAASAGERIADNGAVDPDRS